MLAHAHTTGFGHPRARTLHVLLDTHKASRRPFSSHWWWGQHRHNQRDFVLRTIGTRSSHCSDEIMTTGPRGGVDVLFLAMRNASHRHTSRFSRAGLVPPLSSPDVFSSFLFFSFFFSSLSSKKARAVAFFSLLSHRQKRRQTTGWFFCEHAPLLSFSKTRGPVGFAELRSFRLRTAGLAFSRVGFANQNSMASAELPRFFGERNGQKPHRITASQPPGATRGAISDTKQISG